MGHPSKYIQYLDKTAVMAQLERYFITRNAQKNNITNCGKDTFNVKFRCLEFKSFLVELKMMFFDKMKAKVKPMPW